ncbi:MAG: MraY family glycosyltransferase, partial [Geitlerinemataceae cyanobacterium]
MPHHLYHLLAFILSSLVVLASTPMIRAIGLKTGLVDRPGERKVHAKPMVRLGGVSIFLGVLVALSIVWGMGGFVDISGQPLNPDKEYEIWGVTIGGLIFFLIGLADDLFGLSASGRLLLQVSVAAMSWWIGGVRIDFLSIPFVGTTDIGILSLPITVIWLVGMVNAINWIDGLDGLAAGVSGIAAVIMLIVCLFMQQP